MDTGKTIAFFCFLGLIAAIAVYSSLGWRRYRNTPLRKLDHALRHANIHVALVSNDNPEAQALWTRTAGDVNNYATAAAVTPHQHGC